MTNPIFTKNKDLLEYLKSEKWLQTQRVYDIMTLVDRIHFYPTNPYNDNSQYIGYNAVISALHIHVPTLEYFTPKINDNSKILDIGFGSAYVTEAFSKLTNIKGLVIGIEHIEELYDLGKNKMNHYKNLLVKMEEMDTYKKHLKM